MSERIRGSYEDTLYKSTYSLLYFTLSYNKEGFFECHTTDYDWKLGLFMLTALTPRTINKLLILMPLIQAFFNCTRLLTQ